MANVVHNIHNTLYDDPHRMVQQPDLRHRSYRGWYAAKRFSRASGMCPILTC